MEKLFLRLILILLFIYSNTAYSNQTLSVEINDESYQIEYWPSYFAKQLDIQYVDDISIDDKDIDISFYRGRFIGHPDTLITFSKIGDSIKGLAFFYGQYYEINNTASKTSEQTAHPMQSSLVQVANLSEQMLQKMCPIHTQEHLDMQITAMATTDTNTNGTPPVAFAVGNVNLVADVALALDPEYVSIHGGASNAVIRALQTLDQADMFYRQSKPVTGAGGLGVALNNVSVNVYSNSLPFSVADIIDSNPSLANGNQPEIDTRAYLQRIQANANTLFGVSRTVGAMYTGYDLDDAVVGDGVAGLAFLATTCSALGVSVNEGFGSSSAAAVIAAHEMAHNFGSCHDGDGIVDAANNICPNSSVACPSNGPYIMAPFVNPTATQFSECSIANITSHINTQSCYKQPIDIQINLQNAVPAIANVLTQGNTSVRTFDISNLTDIALTNINISGSLQNSSDSNNPNTEFTTVTLNTNACAIATDRQTYICTVSSLAANNTETLEIVETITATGTGQFVSTTEYQNTGSTQQVDIEPQNSIIELTQTITAPITPPTAPSNIQATALSNGDIEVSWVDNSNNEQAFIIERSEDNGTVFNVIQNNLAANSTNYIDSSLVEGTTYTYRVSASNSLGTTLAATISSATSSTSTVVNSSGGGGGGGAFYFLTIILLLFKSFFKVRY